MTPIYLLLVILFIALILPYFFNIPIQNESQNISIPFLENFENYNLEEGESNFANPKNILLPSNQNNIINNENVVLLDGVYPTTNNNGISNNGSSQIWKDYPIVEVGSYEQITNNMKYQKNPDNGTCMPASMCNDLYKNKDVPSNIINPMSPVNDTCGTRVGYFTTSGDFLAFKSDGANILY
jgi:hypothetical protein